MERFHRAGRNEATCNSWANLLAAEDKMEMFYMAREAVVKYMAKQCESVDLPSGVSYRPSVSPYIWLDKSTGGMPRTALKDQGELSFYSSSGLDNSTGEVLGTTIMEHQLGGDISFNTNSLAACKRKEQDQQSPPEENRPPKKPRLVFTDIQRRTLHAIFKETKRPSKEMQATIAQQLGLEVSTVANFFMNARRRSVDKWRDDNGNSQRESGSTCTKS
ncbi:homeobox protein onecut isoform X14 [Octopus bimaculoides]|uniref:homeobox protein onecut isoform X14 n=1 Tax=Octopus bimaculoides TaxID=37653 RepID=UPI0022E7F790|nr:homeobox protein onecut isoform X14 [Octopus bimaculoides]